MTHNPGNGGYGPDGFHGGQGGGYGSDDPYCSYGQQGYGDQAGYAGQQYGYASKGFPPAPKGKVAAGLLGIFLGEYGVHNFYLGYKQRAITQLVITIIGYVTMIILIGFLMVAVTAIWGLIEGIMILAGADSYQRDADGVPLV